MKKKLAIIVFTIVICVIAYNNINTDFKENIVYTKNIDFTLEESKIINIDNSRIIEKSKEIISSMYNENDFSKFEIQAKISSDNTCYVYLLREDRSGYFVRFSIDEGVLYGLSILENQENIILYADLPIEDLLETAMNYIEKLQVHDLENFILDSYEFYYSTFMVKYKNINANREIVVLLNPTTKKFLEYNYSKINE